MFENIQSNPTNPDSGNNLNPNRGSDNQSNHKNILIGIGVLVLFIFILAGITIGMNTINKPKPVQTKIGNESMATSTENQAKVLIPTEEVASSTANQNNHKEITRAETLAYANFLKIDPTSIDSKINQIKLPINVKVDISNYYDVTRKINLDSYLNNLNKNGFSIIDNPFPVKGSNDFFTGFSALSDNQLPTLITSDFLLYYYQNTLKEVFESVKEENFYDELWDINKNLFDIADKRYRARLAVVGAVNDPILEAARKEAAFLAVTLEILKPKQDQVSANLNDTNKFNIKDLKKYYQVLPTYLKNDVPLEIDLMKEINTNNASQLIKKSPVLTYSKDYSQFILPEEYKKNAKQIDTRAINDRHVAQKKVSPTAAKGPDIFFF
ncbi:MAG: DUF3160 domain-containing protein, partial [Candidatus Falkowbacteria bacterium]|nr:DUF3160 domain-containing protein [Candidatus Falkowbacteria bacterium]